MRRARVVLLGLADLLHVARRLAARELLLVDLAAATDLCDEPLGQGVHDRHADAVQPAGDLVAVAAELAAGVQLRQHDRQRRQSLLRHDVDGDARSVVAHGHGVVRMQRHVDPVVASCEGLVDAVVDHLVDEMVEPAGARRADVHARSEADRLEPFEDGDVLGCISGFSHEKSPANSALAGTSNSTRTSGRYPRLRGSKQPLLRPLCEGPRHESLARVSRLSRRAPAEGWIASRDSGSETSGDCSGNGPGANARRGGAASPRRCRISSARAVSSNAQIESFA